jgi:antirestriction protein ArdC
MAYYKKKFNNDGPSAEDKALEKFTEMMIEKVSTLQSDWKKPWFTEGSMKWPKNMSGREYNGQNALMLMLQCEKMGYKIPVFATFDRVAALNFEKDKQGTRKPVVDENGEKLPLVSINKGERSFPVFVTTFTCIDKDTHERIKYDDYKLMSNEEKKNIAIYPKNQVFSVFNLDQTNMKEARSELYAKYEKENQLSKPDGLESNKMYEFHAMDALIEKNGWVCPIYPKHQDNAYFSISKDEIVVPEKSQFVDGESFYSNLLHEMVHSTGTKERLNRFEQGNAFGSSEYSTEELKAELGAALIASRYGMTKHVKEDSAAYLKSWLGSLKESPDFLKTILLDVKRASSMITQRVDTIKERIEQGLDPIPPKEEVKQEQPVAKESVFYTSIQYLQTSDDTSCLDKMDASEILQEAREYDNGDALDMENTYNKAAKYAGDTVIAEDEHYAVVNNNQVGGTYEILRKVSEKDIRKSINRYGLPSEATDDVKNIGKSMVAEKFEKIANQRIPAFEMNNGSVLYIQYNKEKDNLDVGTTTNSGLSVIYSFPYDHGFNLDQNIEGVHEKLTEIAIYQAEIESENVAEPYPTEEDQEVHHYHIGR